MHPPVRPPAPKPKTAPRLQAQVLVRSLAGTHTRLHTKDNHFPWLQIGLFLDSMPKRSEVSR